MNFRAGDLVCCIDSMCRPDDGPNRLVAGKEYRVVDALVCECGRAHTDVGPEARVEVEVGGFYCYQCGMDLRMCGFRASRFIKLDGQTQEQGVYEGALA